MTSYSASIQSGRVRSGQLDYLYSPTKNRGSSRYGVILAHGAGTSLEYMGGSVTGGSTAWASTEIAARLAFAGIPCVGAEMSGDSFGNDAAMLDMSAALTLLGTAGCSTTKVHLLGVSMGGSVQIRWAGQNPSKVASICGVIPVTNTAKFYSGNQGSLDTTIATGWAVAAPRVVSDAVTNSTTTLTSATAAFTAGDVGKIINCPGVVQGTTISSYTNATTVIMSAPASNSGSGKALRILTPLAAGASLTTSSWPAITAAKIPCRSYYSTADAIVIPQDVLDFCNATGGTATVVDTSTGHSESTVKKFIDNVGQGGLSDYISWIQQYGA
jgi:pimeloyl-ACP methyl ester carboxylesterase